MKALTLALLFLLPISTGVVAQEPDYGTIEDIKALSKLYVKADDDDSRNMIIDLLRGYSGVQVVNSSRDAEIILDYETLTRDVAPGRHGASMAKKSQMRAYAIKPDGSKVIAWTETETFDVNNGFVLGAPNEMNLTQHFVNALQKARGEKTYSRRQLYNNSQKVKKEEKKALKASKPKPSP